MINLTSANIENSIEARLADGSAKLPPKKSKRVKVSDILRTEDGKIDTSANVREPGVSYDPSINPKFKSFVDSIGEQMRVFGRLKVDPVLMELANGKFQIIQGFRRVHALELNGITEFQADVYPELNNIQFSNVLFDGVEREGLNRAETFYAVEKQFEMQVPQREIVQNLKSLLVAQYPRTKQQLEKIGNDSQKLLDSFRGTIQGIQRVVQNHELVRDNYVKVLKGEQSYPTSSEVKELYDLWNEDVKVNPMLTRRTAVEKLAVEAPKFWAKWSTIMATVSESGDGTRSKSTSMKTRKDIDALAKNTDCVLFRLVYLNILRSVDDEAFKKICAIQFELEKHMTEAQTEMIKGLVIEAVKKTAENEPAAV